MTAAVRQGGGWAHPHPSEEPPRTAGPTLEERLAWIRRDVRRVPAECMAHLVAMGLVTGVFRSIDPHGAWWAWLLPCLMVWLARLGLHRHLVRTHGPAQPSALLRWEWRSRVLVLLQGGLTGAACALHEPLSSGVHQLTLLIVVFAVVMVAIPSLQDHVHLFLAYALLTAGPLVGAVVLDTANADHLHLLGSLLLLMGLLCWMLMSHLSILNHLRQQKSRVERLRGQLAEQARSAQAAQAAAEVGNQAKTKLMAAASHDLRQPLLALSLHHMLLRAYLREPAALELLDGMSRGLQSLETMASDLLDYARCESGALSPRVQRIHADRLFERLIPQVGPCAFDRGLGLAWRGRHHSFWGDEVMVERILRNLVLNAIDHTETGGVLVAARSRGGRMVLQVWDSGRGLDEREQARVFDDHYRGANAPQDPVPASGSEHGATMGGSGLGLGIVRRLSHLMGATVNVRSRPGCGSVFEIAFAPGSGGSA